MRLVLYQPDIPQNTGSILRLAACLGVAVDLIEPAGFVITDKGLRRAGLDYLPAATLTRHDSFAAFEAWRRQAGGRLVLVTTRAAMPYTEFAYRPGDWLMLGRESAGVPDAVHDLAEARVVIPMIPGMRSVNVAVAAGMILSEALRQTGGFPATGPAE
ncbi:tRNA (cytidine(34)-2'-O)-methyltransferase [Prosthecodimorpha staleyi]|uniref:tRNA (cytidine(34)-2'-O)-methyltransferase n=1 Tax=Prosthecodimorpha staleyi TaxID=2840188 RepID=A0A947GC98_9HYPH|nr:tRNA (cytidine(34)-2'-O)-methyltransferase [Prosthecodimorpha staleyi]MBT9288951.1 tRNA (cytidine(34)-2'-O)-methyltransferase [Prosthecodimorpha staleyi]